MSIILILIAILLIPVIGLSAYVLVKAFKELKDGGQANVCNVCEVLLLP